MKFVKMMPVQKLAIPLMMKDYDLAIEAQTESGKSLVFVTPIIEHLFKFQLKQDKENIH
jgi:superfamily II DNA/RNA helicase